MGREIRHVPAGWKHPENKPCPHFRTCAGVCYQPLYDEDYDTAAAEWLAGLTAWESGADPDRSDHPDIRHYWDWNGMPPDSKYYRPKWTDAERTHVQIYETVSEGTPVTPPFATKDKLIDYLVKCGDFWDQRRGDGGWSRVNAERFVNGGGFAPSLVVHSSASGADIRAPRDGQFADQGASSEGTK